MEGWELLSRAYRFQSAVFDGLIGEMSDLRVHPKSLMVLQMAQKLKFPNEIARALSIPMPTLSNILRELERSRYIEREVDLEDRRRVVIRVTEEGRSAYEQMRRLVNFRLEDWVNGMDALERQSIRTAFDTLGQVNGVGFELELEPLHGSVSLR